MRIILLVTSINNFGQKGLYNSQEIGLAKELYKLGHEVTIYKSVNKSQHFSEEVVSNLLIKHIPVNKIGNNGLFNPNILDSNVDILVYFSDIQFSVNKIYNWTKKNNIIFIPYVGIINSTNNSKIIRTILNLNAKRIFKIYKENGVLVKTSAVQNSLELYGVSNSKVAPVGLDFDLLHKNHDNSLKTSLKRKYGFKEDDKILLLVGRLEKDRNPFPCIEVLKKLHQKQSNYKLLVIGKGSLYDEFFEKIEKEKLSDNVQSIKQLPNNKMWEVYTLSEGLLTFSKTEIFGMSILEAMYYKRVVFAFHAPGPDEIIQHKISGFLCNNEENMVEHILKCDWENIGDNAYKRIINHFTWLTTAQAIERFSFLKMDLTKKEE